VREFRYRAFISYSHKDEKTARSLHRALENYRPPAGAVSARIAADRCPLRPIFRDQEELTASANLGDSLISALRQSQYLIVICSPSAAESHWTAQEIIEFKKFHGDQRVIAVIAGGEAPACFPEPLLREVLPSGDLGSTALEPLAAEYRGGRSQQRLALLKIAAAMLEVDLDQLVQRDAQRRQRFLAGVAAAALVGILIMTGLTYTAVMERRAAEEARQVAEARRQESEDLVEFMLSDLRQRLEPVGRLDVLDAVGAKVLGYYATQKESVMTPDALGRRARALLLLGEIEDIKGDSGKALALFEQAAETTGVLLAAEPDNQQRVFEHAQSYYWVGTMEWAQGDFQRARTSFESYLSMSERLTRMAPENPDWHLEESYALVALGAVYFELGLWGDAVTSFTRATEVLHELADDAADPGVYLVDLANAYSWQTSALIQEKSYARALEATLQESAAWEQHLAAEPMDVVGLRQSLVALRARVELLLIAGDTSQASAQLTEAESLAERLIEHEPESTLNHEQALHISKTRARLALAQGEYAKARRFTGRCLQQVGNLRTLDADKQFWILEFDLPCSLLAAEVEQREARHAEAQRLIAPTYSRLESLLNGDVDPSEDLRRLWGKANLLRGDIVYTLGAHRDAETHWSTAREALEGDTGELSAERLLLLAAVLSRLGMDARAQELVNELSSLGYRFPGMRQRLASPG
jgi:tetratricopeptide (TPR) repeat protein